MNTVSKYWRRASTRRNSQPENRFYGGKTHISHWKSSLVILFTDPLRPLRPRKNKFWSLMLAITKDWLRSRHTSTETSQSLLPAEFKTWKKYCMERFKYKPKGQELLHSNYDVHTPSSFLITDVQVHTYSKAQLLFPVCSHTDHRYTGLLVKNLIYPNPTVRP